MPCISSRSGSVQVLAAAGTGLVDFLASRKLCADSLFGNVGLDPQVLETPTATIGLDQYCAVMEQAARRSRDPNFGLDYGQQFTPEMLGLIGYIALSSPTVLDAAANLARYFGYHQQQTITTLDRHERFYHLTYRIDSQRIADRSQDALITLGMFCNVFRSAPARIGRRRRCMSNTARAKMWETSNGHSVRRCCSTSPPMRWCFAARRPKA